MKREDVKRENVKGEDEDIAIVGMACLFPKAPDLETYWQNIVSKVDAITELPPEVWDGFPEPGTDEWMYCKRGGFLGPLAHFDPLEYGIMPAAVEGSEPDQWLALKVARDALADAGYGDQIPERHRTAVILGKGNYLNLGNLSLIQHGKIIPQTLKILKALHPEYTKADLQLIQEELKKGLPPFHADTVPGLIPNITASRIANRLDLMGPSYTVDAACASSLIATQIAVRELLARQCDLALVGGVHVVTPDPLLMVFSQLGALSRRQEIRPFDKDADGTILGEGVGMVVLKRREDAERDGHRIYAIIKGIGLSSDGRGLGVMAPRLEGELLALQRAYEQAGISPRTVSLIEAHGTATLMGDAVEVQALSRVFGSRTADRELRNDQSEIRNPKSEILPWCALGSVKSMIGHLMPAAGIAGLIKTALALYHKVLPPTLNVDIPNPKLELERTPFYINTETRPWIHGSAQEPRRAGVNAFGFGGINAHVILEEYPLTSHESRVTSHESQVSIRDPQLVTRDYRSHLPHWDSEVFILQGENRSDLIHQGEQLQHFLQATPDVSLKDLAYTLNVKRENVKRETCLAIVATSREDLGEKLDRALKRLADPACRKIKDVNGIYFFEEPLGRAGKLAFLFPGEGAQYVNMLADLCIHFPEVRACFDEMCHLFADHPRGYTVSDFVFPRPTFSVAPPVARGGEGGAAQDRLFQMDVAVEALLAANHALYTLLDRLGIRPDAMLGHSTGEYSAMRAAGMLDQTRYREHVLQVNGLYEGYVAEDGGKEVTLLAVGTGREQAEAIAEEVGNLYVAMDNCPHQVVLIGTPEVAELATEQIRRQGLIYEVLPFDRPYHTPLFAPYVEVLREVLASWIISPPRVPLYSCTTMAPYPTDPSPRIADGELRTCPERSRRVANWTSIPKSEIRNPKSSAGQALTEVHRIAWEHWVRPVEFRRTIEAMYADGVRLFVEVGPRGNLTTFVEDILRGRPYLAVPANVMRRSGITQLNHLVGLLAAHGVPMQLEPLYAYRAPRRLSLDRPLDATGEGKRPSHPIALATGWPSMDIAEETAARLQGVASPRSQAAGRRSQVAGRRSQAIRFTGDLRPETWDLGPVMSAYLATMERFLEMQQEVMQAYLTATDRRPPTADSAHGSGEAERTSQVAGPMSHVARRTSQAAGSAFETPAGDLRPETWDLRAAESQPAAEAEPSASISQLPTSDLQSPPDIEQILLRLVSERTGYPTEMLDLDLNLEADLGIDSIKRVEILGAFQQEMGIQLGEKLEHLAAHKTLRGMIEFLTTEDGGRTMDEAASHPATQSRASARHRPYSPSSHPAIQPSLPFVQEVLSLTPGEALEARCQVNLDQFPFLREHTLGRQVSLTDPGLTGLPVMPLTMSMEILAEAAHLLVPDKLLVAMKEIRAYRWMALDEGHLSLKVVATRQPPRTTGGEGEGDGVIHVQILDAGATHVESASHLQPDRPSPFVEGTVIFGDVYPTAPLAGGFSLRGERPSHWLPERLYEEGLFHGPAFQGVVSMDRWGEDGAEATLQVLPTDGFFAPDTGWTLLTDPVLLDQPGQVVAFWMAEHLDRRYVVFPFRLEALHLYGPPLAPYQRVTCQARISLVGDRQVRSDLDVVGDDGRIWARFVGWEDRRFDVPRAFLRFMFALPDGALSEPWHPPLARPDSEGNGGDASLPGAERWQARRLSLDAFPEGFFTAHGGLWQRVLAHLVLSRREREVWRGLRTPEPRRLEWLLGRVAAKDAVRAYLRRRYDMVLCPADIEILSDDYGRPLVKGPWAEGAADVPIVSLSHSGGVAVAVAVGSDVATGVGVDIEHLGRMNKDVEGLAFTQRERDLLSSMHGVEQDEWPLRFWCAKEAAAKALGQGMVGGPQALVVEDVDLENEFVRISLAGELARRLETSEVSADFGSLVSREGDFIVATSIYKSQ